MGLIFKVGKEKVLKWIILEVVDLLIWHWRVEGLPLQLTLLLDFFKPLVSFFLYSHTPPRREEGETETERNRKIKRKKGKKKEEKREGRGEEDL